MTISELMQSQNMSQYRLAKSSGIPYMTLNDICSGKTRLEKCSAETVYRLSSALHVSMEDLLKEYLEPRPSFELFKSNVCHRVRDLGDIDFLIRTIESGEIMTYYRRKWYPECLYLLAMVDYLSRENQVPLCEDYQKLRSMKLRDVLYPSSVLAAASVSGSDVPKKQAVRDAIPEFMRFNIVESEVRNVN